LNIKLSVIVPTLNDGKSVSACLASIRNEFGGEILVIDGGSEDSTVEESIELSSRVWHTALPIANLFNLGAEKASGDVLLFVSPACRLPRGWYFSVVNALDSLSIVAGGFQLKIDDKRFRFRVFEFMENFLLRFWKISQAEEAFFVRKEAFCEAGGMQNSDDVSLLNLCQKLKRVGDFVVLQDSVRATSQKWSIRFVLSRLSIPSRKLEL
jgi:glycosyltransferase involved in cell wall biosynthesis